MSLYKYLKENLLLNNLKDTILPNLNKIQDLIFEYTTYNEPEVLDELSSRLDLVIDELDNLGYNYEPGYSPSETDDTFNNILLKYRKNIASFISNFSEDKFNAFNSTTRYISNLVDLQREKTSNVSKSTSLNEAVEVHEELNPAIWNSDTSIKEEVLDELLNIYEEFIRYIEIPLNIVDVEIVGSNASYNYNDTSDIDLHIIVNDEFNYIDKNILQQLYNSKKASFNDKYDLTINGIEVELYIEDMKSSNATNGRFSLLKNEWVKVPEPITYDIPDIKEEVKEWTDVCNQALSSENPDLILKTINDLYIERKFGLEQGGEASVGNLLFKEIRSTGLLDKLKESYYKFKSEELSS